MLNIHKEIGNYFRRFRQSVCQEHQELRNLWRLQGYCIYCHKPYTKEEDERLIEQGRLEKEKIIRRNTF